MAEICQEVKPENKKGSQVLLLSTISIVPRLVGRCNKSPEKLLVPMLRVAEAEPTMAQSVTLRQDRKAAKRALRRKAS